MNERLAGKEDGVGVECAGANFFRVRHGGGDVVGMGDVLKADAGEFVAGIAGDLAELFVDAEKASIGADVGDADGGQFKGGAENIFALAEGRF